MMVTSKTVSGRGNALSKNKIRLVLKGGYKSEKTRTPFVAITVGVGAMKQARWVIGDRVVLLTSPEENRGLLRRVTLASEGWMLSSGGDRKGAMKGQVKTAYTRIPLSTESQRLAVFRNGKTEIVAEGDFSENGVEFSLNP